MKKLLFGVATALAMAVGSANGQVVVGNSATDGQLWVIDLNGGAFTRRLLAGTDAQINGIAADNNTGTLYWLDGSSRLMKATMTPFGMLSAVEVGTTSTLMTSLAFDTVENKLYGYRNSSTTTPEGFYEISTVDGSSTLVFATPTTTTIQGFDYDAVNDRFYVTNDGTSTTAPFTSGRGLYQMDKPIASATFSFLAAFPDADTNIDGVAVGNGKVYLINDTAAQNSFVWDIAGAAFDAPFTPPYTTNGTIGGGAWAPGLIPTSGANVSISITDTPDPLVFPLQSTITYTVTVTNQGPEAADNVMVTSTLPGNVTFNSVQAPGMHSAGMITASLGTMAQNDSVSFDVTVDFNGTTPDTVSYTVNASTTTADPFMDDNSAATDTTVREPQADVSVAITDPADCAVTASSNFDYTFTVSNAGPETANNVMISVTLPSPSDASFVSSSPSGTPMSGVLTVNLGSIGPAGSALLTVTSNAITSGSFLTFSASTAADETDLDLTDNSASAGNQVQGGSAGEAVIKGIFSSYAEQANSVVPGLGGPLFTTFDRGFSSPDGTKLILRADTDAATSADNIILVYNGSSWSVVAREGDPIPDITPTSATNLIDSVGLDEFCSINNAGSFAFSGNFTGTVGDDFVVKNVGGTYILVCEEDVTTAPFDAGATTFNEVTGNVNIFANNLVAWQSTLNGATTATDNLITSNDGTSVLLQESVSVPTGQQDNTMTPTSLPWESFNTASGNGLGFNADGSSWAATGLLNGVTTNDSIMAVNNDVKVQEDVIFGSLSSPVSLISKSRISPNGDWLVAFSNDDGNDYLVRNGVVIAETGMPVPGGDPGETLDDALFSGMFFMVAGNDNGDFVYGSTTSLVDLRRDGVLVFNNTHVIARQNDPVDLNDNGVFDDDAYIRTFNDDNIILTNTDVYVSVTLRRVDAAFNCASDGTEAGTAFIRIPLPIETPCPGDYNGDDSIDLADLIGFNTDWQPNIGQSVPPGTMGDYNGDGMVDLADLIAFNTDWQPNIGQSCP